jgi:ABC-type antimicrobial peptide transport system permease subunit
MKWYGHGVMSYSVATRREEIGVRVALGASHRDIIRLIVGQAVTLAAGGIAPGSIGSVLTNRLLGTLLYGVGSTDAAALTAVTSIMLTVVTLSAYVPAIRAAKVDPFEALRAE